MGHHRTVKQIWATRPRETDHVADLAVQQLRRELGPEVFTQLDTFAKKRMEPTTRANVQGVSLQEVAQ